VNKIACNYAIVRFAPFVETGEFANVGIVMIAPKYCYFGFKLGIKKYARITHFFNNLDHKVYQATLYNLRDELKRATNMLKQHGFDKRLKNNDVNFATKLFGEIIRPRETIVRFSNIRTVLTDNPAEKLEELFGYYIERNFVTKEYQESILEKGVRKLLYDANVGDHFVRTKVGDDEYYTNFPFVEQRNERPIKIIKPLHLAYDELKKIIDHGAAWVNKIEQLKKRDLLPNKVLFTVAEPDVSTKRWDACKEIEDKLLGAGVAVVLATKQQEIIDFAVS